MTIGKFGFIKLILVGFLEVSGVAAMHYTGTLSMQMQADAKWNWTLIGTPLSLLWSRQLSCFGWLSTLNDCGKS
jgi:NO-binding membrane sensor protein with MHYT domain